MHSLSALGFQGSYLWHPSLSTAPVHFMAEQHVISGLRLILLVITWLFQSFGHYEGCCCQPPIAVIALHVFSFSLDLYLRVKLLDHALSSRWTPKELPDFLPCDDTVLHFLQCTKVSIFHFSAFLQALFSWALGCCCGEVVSNWVWVSFP